MAHASRWHPPARLFLALGVATLFLLILAPGHAAVATAVPHDSAGCAPETTTCTQLSFPCTSSCSVSPSVSAGPVTGLGQDQAAYVELDNIPQGDSIGVAVCSLSQGDQVVAYPQCASSIPPQPGCETGTGGQCPNTPSPLQWEFGTVTTSQTVLSISTQYDPDIAGAQPIVSETATQLSSGNYGSFFCDNGPANPCGLVIVDIPQSDSPAISGDGFPLDTTYPLTPGNSVVIPLNWASTGNGCGSAPVMQVDASYSVAQFLPAAGQATCNATGGVAVVPTELPSVDDSGCSSGSGTHCPISDVTDGSVPATFTDDPEDPTTLAELQKAGGKFAYIPIAVSSTEIAFEGEAGIDQSGATSVIPLDSYQLTPAQAAGVMTRLWTSPQAINGEPEDDLCGQLSGKATCKEQMNTASMNMLVQTVNGSAANIDVSTAFGGTPKTLPYTTFDYIGSDENFGSGATPGSKKNYSGDTAFALLNPWPLKEGNVPVSESTLGAVFPSTGSGAVYEITHWMCGAPDVGYTVNLPFGGSQSANDILSSQQILANAELGPLLVTKGSNGDVVSSTVDLATVQNASKCQAISTLPTDFGTSSQSVTDQYNPSSSPITAAHAVSGAMSLYGGQGGFAFAAMDSSEADFFGLLPASLQNAAGSFVGPTQSSITAALNDATANADGTIAPNFANTSDAAAYPMPMITYALISTAPQPTLAQATQLHDMLTNLVNYSQTAGAGTGEPLPAGYVPLPGNLAQEALTDISTDIVGPGGASVGGGAGSSSSSSGAASTSAGTGGQGVNRGGGASSSGGRGSPGVRGGGSGRGSSATSALGATGAAGSSSSGNPVGRFITVTLGDDRFLVPSLLLLALLCLILGPLLYMLPTLQGSPDAGEGGPESEAERSPPGESG